MPFVPLPLELCLLVCRDRISETCIVYHPTVDPLLFVFLKRDPLVFSNRYRDDLRCGIGKHRRACHFHVRSQRDDDYDDDEDDDDDDDDDESDDDYWVWGMVSGIIIRFSGRDECAKTSSLSSLPWRDVVRKMHASPWKWTSKTNDNRPQHNRWQRNQEMRSLNSCPRG